MGTLAPSGWRATIRTPPPAMEKADQHRGSTMLMSPFPVLLVDLMLICVTVPYQSVVLLRAVLILTFRRSFE
ncbi:hypothetical protein L3Y34_001205 [Caenorhabditis briggsae]|uniref:Uncharacterized protein n=1 Tax=Caenorhabditis briggsae TaxID=6238 RepID=A0AAE9IPL5_CAEBR|nr:hypothetical protein L3Y34_001205 [Caenorhabditis briggsae]